VRQWPAAAPGSCAEGPWPPLSRGPQSRTLPALPARWGAALALPWRETGDTGPGARASHGFFDSCGLDLSQPADVPLAPLGRLRSPHWGRGDAERPRRLSTADVFGGPAVKPGSCGRLRRNCGGMIRASARNPDRGQQLGSTSTNQGPGSTACTREITVKPRAQDQDPWFGGPWAGRRGFWPAGRPERRPRGTADGVPYPSSPVVENRRGCRASAAFRAVFPSAVARSNLFGRQRHRPCSVARREQTGPFLAPRGPRPAWRPTNPAARAWFTGPGRPQNARLVRLPRMGSGGHAPHWAGGCHGPHRGVVDDRSAKRAGPPSNPRTWSGRPSVRSRDFFLPLAAWAGGPDGPGFKGNTWSFEAAPGQGTSTRSLQARTAGPGSRLASWAGLRRCRT